MNRQPTISIICPVYQTERYIARCLDSILSQSFHDWELLLIDDGSTDSSGAICDEYALKDKRVNVHHKQNGGVSSARNMGLEKARGEWVLFVDADDFLPQDSIATITNRACDDVDMVMCGFVIKNSNGEIQEKPQRIYKTLLTTEKAIMELFHSSNYDYYGYLSAKLFRADIIRKNRLRFNETIYYGEDRLFIVQYLCHTVKVVNYSTDIVYHYILHSDSAMGTLKNGYTTKFATDVKASILAKDSIFNYTRSVKLRYAVIWTICESAIGNIYRMKQYGAVDKKLHREILHQVKQSGAYPLFVVKYATKRILHPGYFRTK